MTQFPIPDRPVRSQERSVLNIEKAKEKARKFELKDQSGKAIELYTRIIDELDGTPELDKELALFNKVGDLYLKAGNVSSAVEMYERAANRYAESGLANNAIALCNKILRNAPGRTQVYLKLAKLMVQRGFVAEAKQNLLEYAERMQRGGRLPEAFDALKDFADLSPDNQEIRLALAEQLKASAKTAEAREQLSKLYTELQTSGDTGKRRATLEKMRTIDPEYDVEAARAGGRTSELIFLDLDDAEAAPPTPAEPELPTPDELTLETTSLSDASQPDAGETVEAPDDTLEIERASAGFSAPDDVDTQEIAGLDVGGGFMAPEDEDLPSIEIEPTVFDGMAEAAGGAPVEPLEPAPGEEEPTPAGQHDDLGVIHTGPGAAAELGRGRADGGAVDVPELDLEGLSAEEAGPPPGGRDLAPPLEGAPAPPESAPDVAQLEARVADNPDNPELHRALGEALIEHGERTRGLEELDIALGAFEAREDWVHAEGMAEEILRLDTNSIRHHQKRVEYAFRKGARGRLIDAYLGLADALFRSGAVERSRAVYQRVLEHDPGNETARRALEAVESVESVEPGAPAKAPPEPAREPAPVAASGAAPPGFVDLEALILGEESHPRDTRMRVEEEEPTGDEQRDFEMLLAKFKRGIEANVEDEDWQAHYDLGIAFKEMGLLDEAISEFQKALRSSQGRLKTAEALGRCFYEKGQYSVGSTVLRRAIDSDPGGDEQKIGLLYWLGRSEEEQDRGQQALECYQRVFAIDITFADIRSRVKSLAQAVK